MRLVISHHPGGAELISNYINYKKIKCKFLLSGPAKKIFKKNLKNFESLKSKDLIKNLPNIKEVFFSSGIEKNYEIKYLNFFKEKKIKTITFIDHWAYYKERFVYKKKYIYPDEIWTFDKFAFKKAKKLFNLKIRLIKNFYLEKIKKKYSEYIKSDKYLLFVSQPLKEQSFYWKKRIRYDQFKAFNFFLKKKHLIKCNSTKILIKIHPLENLKNWENLKSNISNKQNFKITQNKNLPLLFSKAEAVIGCASTLMSVSFLLGIKTFCAIPPNGKKNNLPFKKIKYLRYIR